MYVCMYWLGLGRLFLRLWTVTVASSIIKHLNRVKQADSAEKNSLYIRKACTAYSTRE